jgi:hypothetical protein
MRRIVLKGFKKPDKASIYNSERAYSFSFYSGQIAEFSSRYEMERFMTEANKALNDYLVEMLELFVAVHSEYWRQWLYLDVKPGSNTRTARSCEVEFETIPTILDKIVSGLPSYNGSYQPISQFITILNGLENVINLMSTIRYEKLDHLELKRFCLVERQVSRLKNDLEHFVDRVNERLKEKEMDPDVGLMPDVQSRIAKYHNNQASSYRGPVMPTIAAKSGKNHK